MSVPLKDSRGRESRSREVESRGREGQSRLLMRASRVGRAASHSLPFSVRGASPRWVLGHSASSFFSPWSRSLAKDNLALGLSRVGRSLATQKSWCRVLGSDGSVTVAIVLSWATRPAAVSAASLPGRPVWESTLRKCTVAPRSTARSSSERIFVAFSDCSVHSAVRRFAW